MATEKKKVVKKLKSKEKKITKEAEKEVGVVEVAEKSVKVEIESREKIEVDATQVGGVDEKVNIIEAAAGVPMEKKSNKWLVVGIVLSIVIAGATIGLFYLRANQVQKLAEEKAAEEVVIAEMTPTPTPTLAALERGEISLDVLNGSGVSGAAGRVADTFEELGYEIVEIGNADDTVGNELYTDLSAEEVGKLLKDVLEELEIEEIAGELDDLETESEASAVIILGEE